MTIISIIAPYTYVITISFIIIVSSFYFIALCSSSKFYLREIGNESIFNIDIFRPFKPIVWICIIIFTFFISILIKIVAIFESKSLLRKNYNDRAFLATFGLFCQQGNQITFHSRSGRCLIILSFIVSIMIYTFYASVLLSTLVGTKHVAQVKTLEQLSDSNIPVAIQNVTFVRYFLKVFSFGLLLFLLSFFLLCYIVSVTSF